MSNLIRSQFQGHPYHLVSPSPWPIFTCMSLFALTTSGVSTIHGFEHAGNWLPSAFILLVSSMSFWFRDVISEGTYIGNHTLAVQKGLNMGVALFIVSEALFFLAIFWAYFHSALSPTVELGAQWPPIGIEAINAFELPLLNTAILLASGVTITYGHHSLIQGNRNGVLYGALFTIILAFVFTACQGVEYSVSSFTLTDGAYGSCFYFGTGLITAPITYNSDNITRSYSNDTKPDLSSVYPDSNEISPYWITGFVDAEGSFIVKVGKDNNRKHNVRIIPIFSIELHKKDVVLLELIQNYFGIGIISYRMRNRSMHAMYTVQSINDLREKIIPHFNKHPLLTQKGADFMLWCSIIEIMYNNKNLSYEDVIKILSIKSSINKGLPNTLKEFFPEVKDAAPVERPIITTNKIESPFWLAGFTDGEGCFYVKVSPNTVGISFSISQHIRDAHLMSLIQNYFTTGIIETVSTRPNQVNLVINRLQKILQNVIPFFETHNLLGVKSLDFKDFCEIANIMKEGEHLQESGRKKIISIKAGMNLKRRF